MTNKDNYKIGDFANLLGISRDTLRYYEKRGLLSPQKNHNGAPYYSKQDVNRLINIMYQRKMNIPLNDMEMIWSDSNTVSHLSELLNGRIEEEEAAIREHKKTIARLKLTQQNFNQIEHHLGEIREKAFPAAYTIVPHTTIEESTSQWFTYAKEYPGLDLMYEFDEYEFSTPTGSVQTEYQNTQLILYRWLAEYVDYPELHSEIPLTESHKCLSMYCATTARIPSVRMVKKMLNYAEEHGYTPTGKLLSTYALYGLHKGNKKFHLELFMPVEG